MKDRLNEPCTAGWFIFLWVVVACVAFADCCEAYEVHRSVQELDRKVRDVEWAQRSHR